MNTRSLSGSLIPRYVMPALAPKYDVDIDFDAAQAGWAANKKRCGACYTYTCTHICKNGKVCGKQVNTTEPRAADGPLLCKSHIIHGGKSHHVE